LGEKIAKKKHVSEIKQFPFIDIACNNKIIFWFHMKKKTGLIDAFWKA
jgi:hypothetical protein